MMSPYSTTTPFPFQRLCCGRERGILYHGIKPSIDKGRHGFDGQKCAHTASSPLTIRQVFSAGHFLSAHISAPAKLPAPDRDGFSSDFWFLRRRRAESAYSRRCCRATFLWSEAGARQGEKGKKRRKDTLSGVFALVKRWYRDRMTQDMERKYKKHSVTPFRGCD